MPTDPAAIARKLKLTTADRPAIIGGPDALRAALESVHATPIASSLDGRNDWILLFAADRAALAAELPAAVAALEADGLLWLAYPKGSSKAQTDLTRDAGWEPVLATDLRWLVLVSIDETWSAFSLRRHRPGEARQAAR